MVRYNKFLKFIWAVHPNVDDIICTFIENAREFKVKTSIKIKKKLYLSGDDVKYKLYRNKICSLTRISKKQFFFEFFKTNLKNMKKTWQGINNLLNRKNKKTKTIDILKDYQNHNNITHDMTRIPNILNEHFATVGQRLARCIPPTQCRFTDFLKKTKSPDSSFYFQPFTSSEIRLEILCTPNNKSHGLYSCPIQILRCASNILSNVLEKIFNCSIKTGVYPSKLKMSKIITIFKTEDETEPNNYRPISLLSNFNRIFEKILYKRMKSFINDQEILNPSQYGFREKHSTQHAIIDIVNTIQTNMDKRLFSCGVFIDLKKAFDTVDHAILLDKLNHYGFRGIINKWFSSYLQGRTQTTQIGSYISERTVTSCGVPQGSVLGPLLFLLYVNDITSCSNKLTFYLFADDTNILYAHKNLKLLEQIINTELHKLYNWLTSNKLTLNLKKSNFVIFRPYKNRLTFQPIISIFVSETNKKVPLDCKDYVKYLGLLIDYNLSWKNHIEYIALKISKVVGIIAKLRHYVPLHTLLNIYQSLIIPSITYGLTVWGQACKSYLEKILVLQKRALRFMYFKKRMSTLFSFLLMLTFCLLISYIIKLYLN